MNCEGRKDLVYRDPILDAVRLNQTKYLISHVDNLPTADTMFLDRTGTEIRLNSRDLDVTHRYNSNYFLVREIGRFSDVYVNYRIDYKERPDSLLQVWTTFGMNQNENPSKPGRVLKVVVFTIDDNGRIATEVDTLQNLIRMFEYDDGDHLISKTTFSLDERKTTDLQVFQYDKNDKLSLIKLYAGGSMLYQTHYYSDGVPDSTVIEELSDSVSYKDEVVKYEIVSY
jgi:hypothetical protein